MTMNNVTMGELQNAPIPDWMADTCDGFEFCATLQLRTPLRVLFRHGELYLKNDGQQPQIAREMWEGIWLPSLKSYEDIACGPDSTGEDIEVFKRMDAALAASSKVASEIGPVRPDDYLPFLIAIRKIVEINDSIENRIEKLREMPMVDDWKPFVERHGGIDNMQRKTPNWKPWKGKHGKRRWGYGLTPTLSRRGTGEGKEDRNEDGCPSQ